MKTKPNDPASPIVTGQGSYSQVITGLSKREHFAAMALQGVINIGFKADGNADPAFTARDAVAYADALIAELNKPTEQEG